MKNPILPQMLRFSKNAHRRFSYVELFKGRESISDREARMVAIFTLKKMIRSWLDETYPNMPEAERQRRAEIMDISLLEEKKEQNMKSLYEINSVIRMSFIEMQFIKKVSRVTYERLLGQCRLGKLTSFQSTGAVECTCCNR